MAAALTVILSILAALLLYATVDRPLDRWRQRRVRASAAAARAKGAAVVTA